MSSRKIQRAFVYLLTAHLVSALHVLGLVAWEMRHFLLYEGLSPLQQLVERIVGPILSVTQFPGIHISEIASDAASMFASFLTGYLIGLVVVYFAATTVIQPNTSFIWWLSVLIVVTDVICVLVFQGLWFFSVFLRILLVPVPVTLFAGIVVLWRYRNSMAANGNDG